MKILAIDTSGQVAGCALLEDGRLLSEYNSLSSASALRKTHSQTLMPMLESLRDQTELDLHTLDAIAVTAGPGSFTGLRIGAATAKGLGLALEKPVIAVPTLEALAFGVWTAGGDNALICPVMDARRRQVYTAAYTWKRNSALPEVLMEGCAVDIRELAERLNEEGREVVFAGDGVAVYSAEISELLAVPFCFAPPHMLLQRAGAVAAAAAAHFEAEKEACLISAADFRPVYLRKSQAEREREANGGE